MTKTASASADSSANARADDDLAIEQTLARQKLDRRMLLRMLLLLKPVRGLFFSILAIEIFLVSTVFMRPFVVEHAIDFGLLMPVSVDTIIGEQPIATVDYDVLLAAIAILCSLWAGRFVAFIASRLLGGRMAFRVLNTIRQQVFDHVHTLGMRFFDSTKVGRIVSRADNDVNQLEQALIEGPILICTSLLRFGLAVTVLYIYAPPILYALLPLIPTLLIIMLVFQKIGTRLWARIGESKSGLTAHLVETIAGVRMIQQSSFERLNGKRYAQRLDDLDTQVYRGALGWTWFFPFLILLFTTGLALVIWQGGLAMNAGTLSKGALVTCIFYVFLFLGPMADFGMIFEHLTQGIAAAQRIFLLLDTPAEIVDAPQARTLKSVRGDISCRDMCFSYTLGVPVLKNINVDIPAGQMCAIVGPTGHGKSTLIQLLARFYDRDSGSITLDGHDIAEITQASVHRHIGVVLQDNILFSGSILDNLRLACHDESTDEKLIQACRELCIDDIIERLPHGYQTQVGARGDQLSHGQRQLVCLVRAYLADPAVLILDEATSSIDAYTERRVQKSLRRLCVGRTAIIIAHRLSTIRDADNIIVITEGSVAEQGTHDALVASNGAYAALYASYEAGHHNPSE